jgi:tryptophan synthase alpha chain
MNRIESSFAAWRKAGRKALVGYLTAGDADMEQSERTIRSCLEAGLDVLEIGVPFSDPTADGPVIQAASHRALRNGATLGKTLELVGRLRKDFAQPIVLFGYANPFYRFGYERVCAEAAGAGADGLLIVDMPHEETAEIRPAADRSDLCIIPLVAPTTPAERARTILAGARGFIYYIMVRGVTGARASVADDVGERVSALRQVSSLPVAVGFGVSRPEHVAALVPHADAVVVGSALVQAATEGRAAELTRSLKEALK